MVCPLSPIVPKTAKRQLVFQDSFQAKKNSLHGKDSLGQQSLQPSEKLAQENSSMLNMTLGQILQALSSQQIEKEILFDEESKELKKYFLNQALVAVTPTLLREFTNCLVFQAGLFEMPKVTSPFCQDLFEFLRTRTKAAELKLKSYNHQLTLPTSI